MSSKRRRTPKERREAWTSDSVDELPTVVDVSDAPLTKEPAPDAGSLSINDWPLQALPPVSGDRSARFQVVVRQSVVADVRAHALSQPDVEICGVLLGNVFHDQTAPYLHIRGSIRGKHAGNHGGHVTFTAATWQQIQEDADRLYPDLRIVGWYHSHPSFGIFLSEMDLFIQKNFFDLPWQIAYVCDPIGKLEGLFVWRNGVPSDEEFLIEDDTAPGAMVPRPESDPLAAGAAPVVAQPPAASAATNAVFENQIEILSVRILRLEQRQRGVMIVLGLAILLMLVWPMVLQTITTDNQPLLPGATNPSAGEVGPDSKTPNNR